MNRINVRYHEQLVGVLAEARGGIVFEYDPAFIASGHELSPLHLPLGPGLRSRSNVPRMELPGVFDDSLPDAWGERLMLEWFRRRGTPRHDVTPLMKLAYVGHRGMGALVYEPELDTGHDAGGISLAELHRAALEANRSSGEIDLDVLAQVGSSAGGAHPKALIALPRRDGGTILAGAGELPATHEAWIVKLDLSRDNSIGPVEHAYALMAHAAGIPIPPTRLLETRHGGHVRHHFAVKRFDRDAGERIHHHSLAGLYHMPGSDLSYEILLRVTRRLTRDEREVWLAYRRAAFNVLASNRDDHGKNQGFLYRGGQWTLGPAFDLTFHSPRQLPERGMSICGERAAVTRAHLLELADSEALDRREALRIMDEVSAAISAWKQFADQARVSPAQGEDIGALLALTIR